MGSSAFEPVVLADVRSVKNKIDLSGLTSDVIGIGDVIRYDASTDTYLRAKADTETNANFVGIVENITGTDFTIVYSGEISLPNSVMSLISGYTGAQVFYLSGTDAGKLTTTAPSNPGHVIKPVIITKGLVDDTDDVDGIVVNSVGTRISGDSIVDLSDIQPVGSVLAFAGNTGEIPTGWDICDGGFLSITSYSDLYSALNQGKLYGFKQSVNFIKEGGNGILNTSNIVGSVFYVSRAGLTDAFKCTILSGTISNSTTITSAEVIVEPTYNNGGYHNTELQLNDLCRFEISGQETIYKITNSPSKTEFRKPDMRARFILGSSRGITGLENTGFNSYTIGNIGGEEAHTLTIGEMPIHNHSLTIGVSLSGQISVSHNLITSSEGSHTHNIVLTGTQYNDQRPWRKVNVEAGNGNTQVWTLPNTSASGLTDPLLIAGSAGSHSHTVSGPINVSTNNLTPIVNGSAQNAGQDLSHNNVPQHIVMYWIIKTRKDSYAKLYKLGPSGGGAVIAKNTAKRWARATAGAGCTVDASYGTWGVARLGTGHYEFYHDLLSELGTADQSKYIVEVAVTKGNSGATQMFIGNPYGYQGLTFGVRVYDIMGTTFSDHFQFINLTVYGGGTAL